LQLTQAEFAKGIGLSDAQVNRIELEKSELSEPLKYAIAYVYNVNPEWWTNEKKSIFLNNKKPELSITKEEETLLTSLRQLSKKDKEKVFAIIQAIL
jgi:transcriptional regulator with XRE-family HTH domain